PRSRHPFPTRRSSDLVREPPAAVVQVEAARPELHREHEVEIQVAVDVDRERVERLEERERQVRRRDLDERAVALVQVQAVDTAVDRKSTRLNSSHVKI